ncbi:MAG: hypothetical protein ACSW8C_02440 [bacterium]
MGDGKEEEEEEGFDKIEPNDVMIHATPSDDDLTESSSTYEPSISSKSQSGVIDYNFYYYSANKPGGRWMSRLAKFYDGRTDEEIREKLMHDEYIGAYPSTEAIKGVRRGITPSAMVDSAGDLYALSLVGFGDRGPRFQLMRCDSFGTIQDSIIFEPWYWDFEDIPQEPKFDNEGDDTKFHWCFHNVLSPCIFQDIYYGEIIVFCLIPNRNQLTDQSDAFEGGLFLKFRNDLNSCTSWYKWNDPTFHWTGSPKRCLGDDDCFQNCWGNYQGLLDNNAGHIFWLCGNVFTEGPVCHRRFARGNFDHDKVPGWGFYDNYVNYLSSYICPRFVVTRDKFFCAFAYEGCRIRFCLCNKMGASAYVVGKEWTFDLNRGIEMENGFSDSVYNFDFCVLNTDGTPCTNASPNLSKDEPKIICVFSLGGRNYTGLDTNKTYINWNVEYAVGILSSMCCSETSESTSAWAQNTIYVTGLQRGNGPVGFTNTEKSDEYRLYLNSHKIVPYTSPSGKHYMIYAYCYPGKKEHLYLGYAQYFIDSNYRVRLLSQTEFRDASGNSFGNFTHCSRIISMDLKNGHLWITFVKDTGWDATGQSIDVKQKAGCYYYFHILASDLIQE